MKNRSAIITLSIVLTMWFYMAFECSSGEKRGFTPPTFAKNEGFNKGHRLSGRWSCSDQGIKSFTFRTDGTFERAGASSGTSSGGGTSYVSEADSNGTYELIGTGLYLTFLNGGVQNGTIRIVPFTDEPDYSQETPPRLSIKNENYSCLYTNVGGE